jgi:hypothetical protein
MEGFLLELINGHRAIFVGKSMLKWMHIKVASGKHQLKWKDSYYSIRMQDYFHMTLLCVSESTRPGIYFVICKL